jgi:hypothetical protein
MGVNKAIKDVDPDEAGGVIAGLIKVLQDLFK